MLHGCVNHVKKREGIAMNSSPFDSEQIAPSAELLKTPIVEVEGS